jgi:hypothetical protein
MLSNKKIQESHEFKYLENLLVTDTEMILDIMSKFCTDLDSFNKLE